jgi:hypothetical protein
MFGRFIPKLVMLPKQINLKRLPTRKELDSLPKDSLENSLYYKIDSVLDMFISINMCVIMGAAGYYFYHNPLKHNPKA